jgi:hypothetical protein
MKKILVFLVLVVAFAGYAAYQQFGEMEPAPSAGASAPAATAGMSGANAGASPRRVAEGGATIQARASDLANRAYTGDPVAIERLVDLNGSCRVANAIRPDAKVGRDMARLQELCRNYTPIQGGKIDWSMGITSELDRMVKQTRASQGELAVGEALARELKSNDPYRARAILQYSARNDEIPSSLKPFIGQRIIGTDDMKDQLEVLSQLEFCRRGGDCGSGDFSTVVACSVIGPCEPGEGLIALFRRKTTPDNFSAASRLSRVLASR